MRSHSLFNVDKSPTGSPGNVCRKRPNVCKLQGIVPRRVTTSVRAKNEDPHKVCSSLCLHVTSLSKRIVLWMGCDSRLMLTRSNCVVGWFEICFRNRKRYRTNRRQSVLAKREKKMKLAVWFPLRLNTSFRGKVLPSEKSFKLFCPKPRCVFKYYQCQRSPFDILSFRGVLISKGELLNASRRMLAGTVRSVEMPPDSYETVDD